MILSKSERVVVRLKLQGYERNEIAKRLFKAPGTIQRHLHQVYAKNHIKNEIFLFLRYSEEELKINFKELLQ